MEYYGQVAADYFVINVLKHKRDGYFLEIGSQDPININNTFMLESKYNWKGIMVEYDTSRYPQYLVHRKNSIHLMKDAREINYYNELQKANFPKNVDYLQIDLEVDNKSTIDVLEKLNSTVFDEYKFAIITFETDIYRGDFFNTRNRSREIFESRGYVRVFSDVMISLPELGPDNHPFEDWYVHPALVDMTMINRITQTTPIHYKGIISKIKDTLQPIIYRGEGKLGDFILQLSVINEIYLKTGRKGILYIYTNNIHYTFTHPIEKTYQDTYNLIIKQPYIQDYKIWNSEPFDINLSAWRQSPLLYNTSWHVIFKNEYNIDWGRNKWINTQIDPVYSDKIVLTYNERNIPIKMSKILSNYDISKLLLIGYSDNDKTMFESNCNMSIPFIKCSTIEDMAIIINSCKLFIGALSSPLALAQAAHSNTIALIDWSEDSNHNLLSDILPNYTTIREAIYY